MNAAPVLNRVEVLAYGGVSATGIYIGGGRPVINETNVRALSATASIAIEIYASLLTTLNGVSITAQARSTAWGLRLFESKIIANRFTAKISGSNTSTLYGIENTSFLERDSSLPLLNIELSRAKIYSEGGAHAYGIRLQPVTGRAGLGESNYRAVAKLDRIDITSQGIGYKYGIYNGSRKKMEISKATIYSNPQITINRSGIYSDNYSSTYIHNSHVWSADTNAVSKYAPELRLYNSFIEQANSDNDSLNIKCYLVVSGSEELGEDCTL